MSEFTTSVRIADLDSVRGHTVPPYFEGRVAVLWPFSSVAGRSALLLSETDIDRRSACDRIRIQFSGEAATQLQNASVQIGDSLGISLGGAEWQPEEQQKQHAGAIPGAKWSLLYSDIFTAEVCYCSGPSRFMNLLSSMGSNVTCFPLS